MNEKKNHLSCQTELLNCENSASFLHTNRTIGRLKSQATSPVQLQQHKRLAHRVSPCMFLPTYSRHSDFLRLFCMEFNNNIGTFIKFTTLK